MTQYMLHSNASTTATQTTNATWCLWEIKTNIPKQEVSTCHFSLSVRCQPTILTPSSPCLQCHDGSYFSLSLSTPVPKLPGKTKLLQASVSRSPVQTSVKPHCSYTLPNLRCSTTRVLFPDYINFSSHTCGNPILSWTKVIDKAKIWPSRFPCHSFFFLLPPPGMTPGSSSTTHCALRASKINYNLTNLSRCTPFLMVLFCFPFNAF